MNVKGNNQMNNCSSLDYLTGNFSGKDREPKQDHPKQTKLQQILTHQNTETINKTKNSIFQKKIFYKKIDINL